MSFVARQAAHCDQCSHEWLVVGASTPTHCAKCKSRRWNSGESIVQQAIKRSPKDAVAVTFIKGSVAPPVQTSANYYVPAKYRK